MRNNGLVPQCSRFVARFTTFWQDCALLHCEIRRRCASQHCLVGLVGQGEVLGALRQLSNLPGGADVVTNVGRAGTGMALDCTCRHTTCSDCAATVSRAKTQGGCVGRVAGEARGDVSFLNIGSDNSPPGSSR